MSGKAIVAVVTALFKLTIVAFLCEGKVFVNTVGCRLSHFPDQICFLMQVLL